MTDFFSFLSDTDFTMDDTGEIILTTPLIQYDHEFVIDIPIRITSNCNTIIKSQHFKINSDIFSASSVTFESTVTVQSSNDFSLKNCIIKNAKHQNSTSFLIERCENASLNHVTVTNPSDVTYGIIIYNSIVNIDDLIINNHPEDLIRCENNSFVAIKNSKISNSTYGISIEDQSSIEILNCTFSDISNLSISAMNSRCLVKNNTFQQVKNGLSLDNIEEFSIENNHFTNVQTTGIFIHNNSNGIINENTFVDLEGCGINCMNSDVLITKNSLKNIKGVGIYIKENCAATIDDNKISNSETCSIASYKAQHLEVNRTEIDGCKLFGIRVTVTESCLIQNTKISNVQFDAIQCGNNSKITVRNCAISHVNMNAFFSFVGGFITAENNKIEDVRQSMAKLTFNGGGLFIDNRIENCVKLNECIMPSHYFFSGNGNFPNVTNDRSKIGDSIVYEEPIQIDDQLCLKCHKNKRNNYILKCGHKVLCNECAEKMKSDDRCPLCNNYFIKIVAEKDVTDEKKCIICFENEADCIISPCGHICACESCLKNWFSSKKSCPVCRKENCTYSAIFDYKQEIQVAKTMLNEAEIKQEKKNETNENKLSSHINEIKALYDKLITFLENPDENDFKELIKFIDIQKDEKDRDKITDFLRLITSIANNHRRVKNFYKKIFQILLNYKEQIKQTFSNYEIFNIFQSNKKILLFLIENQILTIDEEIFEVIFSITQKSGIEYWHFFYPELKKFIGEEKIKEIEKLHLSENPKIREIEDKLLSLDSEIINRFDEKRNEGENDTYICSLIRQDSVEEFVSYVNRTNYPLKSEIAPSIFETNSFLLENEKTTLIEYSAFFGAIQIFQYLRYNNVELKPSLWLYAIHSQNAELIHFLESNEIEPPKSETMKNKHESIFIESIKCHHNSIADYIKNNFLFESNEIEKNDEVFCNILKYHNYAFFPSDFNGGDEFYYLCFFNYSTLVNIFINKNERSIKEMIDKPINIKEAIEENKIEFIYCLLLKESEINENFLKDDVKTCLKKVAIPSSITSIASDAFSECSSLVQVAIPPSIASIEKNAFYKCSSLKQITIPSSVKSIGRNAFSHCNSLTQITIPHFVTRIDAYAFSYCSKLAHVTILSPITSIEDGLFNGCSSLVQITIPSSVKMIGEEAFSECTSLKKVTIPSTVTSIGDYAFSECNSLIEITIPSSLTEINDYAFNECTALKKVTIPSSVTSIGNYAFYGCSSLQQIEIPASVNLIGNHAFNECSSLGVVEVPSTVTSIGYSAFSSEMRVKNVLL